MASRLIAVHQEAEAPGSPATPSHGWREARTLRQSTATFGILASAFAISALYQAYRGTLMEIPEDAFTATTALIYAALVGVSALVLTDKRWAWGLVSALVLVFLALGSFYYYPVVATARTMGPIDWLEGSVFMGLITVAGFVCALRLLGASLAPNKG